MVRISRKLSAFLSLLILCAGAALGQTAEVTHNVNLRSDPSTGSQPIRLLTAPTRERSGPTIPSPSPGQVRRLFLANDRSQSGEFQLQFFNLPLLLL